MKTEEVLAMIDNSVRDTEVSEDAMRWTPDWGPETVREHNTRRLRTVLAAEVFRQAREEVDRNISRGLSAPSVILDEVDLVPDERNLVRYARPGDRLPIIPNHLIAQMGRHGGLSAGLNQRGEYQWIEMP